MHLIALLVACGADPAPPPEPEAPAAEAPAAEAASPEPSAVEAAATTNYACPMHPDVTSTEPGACPTCGMDLVDTKAEHGHGSHDH